ncbi:MAG: ATP-binding protein, partial [Terriglobales bacterium]
ALARQDWAGVAAALALRKTALQGGFAAIFGKQGNLLAGYQLPAGFHPRPRAPDRVPVGIGGRGYMVARAPLAGAGTVEVAIPVPSAITAQIVQLAHDRDRYQQLAQERKSLRVIYTGYLALLTLAVLFGATWMALYLSKQVTEPMGALAAATQEIARGNLAYRVNSPARQSKDEIGLLVNSFNRMAADLEASRRYTEALLDNTPSAVISLDRSYAIARVNPAVERLFTTPRAPKQLDDLFDSASVHTLHRLLRKAGRWPSASGQLEVATSGGRQLTLAATVAAIRSGGYVLVLEDLTDLLRMQKTAAWREVAQRIAHEIKNPLTPIALSAQRIQRRLADPAVVSECAATIENEARSLQRLVDEFSSFARFPHAQPIDCDLNDVIGRALRSFDGRLEGIEIRTLFEPHLPKLRLDPDDMKRVFLNLIDNAAEAMRRSPYRQLTLATQRLDGIVEAVVADTGHGLPAGDKQHLFLPYYSTRERGSGLGLAIVQRIVEDNGGALRAEDNEPLGARFIVELPVEGSLS